MSKARMGGRSWQELLSGFTDGVWPVIQEREVVYTSPRGRRIYRIKAEFHDFAKEYFVSVNGAHAGVVVSREGRILLIRQYRLLIDQVSCEVPGGAVDEHETPEQAAVRECLEETGERCLNLKPLLFYHMGLDTIYNPTHLFYTSEMAADSGPRSVQVGEVSGCEWVPLDRCIEMISEQQIIDSFSIIALLSYSALSPRPG